MRVNALKNYNKKEVYTAYALILPLFLLLCGFIFIPVVAAFVNSLYQDISFLGEKKFIGFDNYVELLKSGKLQSSLLFTMNFSIVSIIFEIVIGTMIALFLNESFRGRSIYRALILLPWAIPSSVSGKIWVILYDYQFGLWNWMLTTMNMDPINFLGSSSSAFWAIIVANVWKALPFVVLLILAGLQAIPGDLYSQAKIDGANMLKSFTHITFPLLLPIILVTMLFRTISNIQIFDLIYILTKGGPGGTTDALSYLGFSYFGQSNYGLGSAISVIIFLLTGVISIIYIYIVSRINTK